MGKKFAAKFRLLIAYCKRAHSDAAVAYLIPVVPRARPPVCLALHIHGQFDALFNHGLAQHLALLRRPCVVQPVITYRKGVRHLRGIQKMARIPVRERRRCGQFLPCAVAPLLPPIQPIQQAQRLHTAQHTPAGCQEPLAIRDFIFRWRRIKQLLPFGDQPFVPLFQNRLALHITLEPRKIRLHGNQPRMPLFQAAYDFRAAGNRDGRLGCRRPGGLMKRQGPCQHNNQPQCLITHLHLNAPVSNNGRFPSENYLIFFPRPLFHGFCASKNGIASFLPPLEKTARFVKPAQWRE